MANFKKYDARIDSLVMETRTEWDPEVGNISEDDRKYLSSAVHASPQHAESIEYIRSHTGFTRIITVTVADIARLYHERTS